MRTMARAIIIFGVLGMIVPMYNVLFAAHRKKRVSTQRAHDFSFTTIDGESLPLRMFEGKVLLVVNTASRCKFTPQYQELEELYNRYKDQGLAVIGVPSNDFGNQEPGSSEEISCFLEDNYPVTFTITEKEIVHGKNAHPFYAWANAKAGFFGSPTWNFHKYLIGKDGHFIDWFASTTSPLSHKVTKAIKKALKAS